MNFSSDAWITGVVSSTSVSSSMIETSRNPPSTIRRFGSCCQ